MFKGLRLTGSLNLKEVFNNGDILRNGDNFDEIMAGLAMQPSLAYDTNFADDVRSFNPFHPNTSSLKVDSLDINFWALLIRNIQKWLITVRGYTFVMLGMKV